MLQNYHIIALALVLAACGGDNPPPPPPPNVISLSMDAARWKFQYSPGMPANPSPHDNGWSFQFPLSDGVHYLMQATAGKFGNSITATTRLERSQDGSLQEVQPCGDNAPRARLMFQRRGDDMSGAGPMEHYRWWTIPTIDLANDGPTTLTVTSDPAQWSSVYGKHGNEAPDAWSAAANDVSAIGLTFGGCFAGHGVYAPTGQVKFIADDIAIR